MVSELELVEDCCHAVPGLQPAKLTITNHSGGEEGGGGGYIQPTLIMDLTQSGRLRAGWRTSQLTTLLWSCLVMLRLRVDLVTTSPVSMSVKLSRTAAAAGWSLSCLCQVM